MKHITTDSPLTKQIMSYLFQNSNNKAENAQNASIQSAQHAKLEKYKILQLTRYKKQKLTPNIQDHTAYV